MDFHAVDSGRGLRRHLSETIPSSAIGGKGAEFLLFY